MKKVLFATGNESKAKRFKKGLLENNIEIITINDIEKNIDNPHYIFFSDDPDYVKSYYSFANMTVVDWNKGEKSIFDMYLMSQCKFMILANSTFSYWAARFNKKAEIICCPNKWTNDNEPDIILDNWIKIK